MKNLRPSILIIIAFFLATGNIIAQKKETKKIIIIEKTIDENGKEVTKKIVKEGDAADNFEWHGEDGEKIVIIDKGDGKKVKVFIDDEGSVINLNEMHGKMKQNVNVNVVEENGVKKISIQITGEDGGVETINWQGDGEFPEKLKKELEGKGVYPKILEGGDEDVHVFIHDGEGEMEREMVIELEEEIKRSSDLRLDNISINIASDASDKTIHLKFKGKSVPTSVSLTDNTGKQVYHNFVEDFSGTFDEEISLKGAAKSMLELNITQGKKTLTKELK